MAGSCSAAKSTSTTGVRIVVAGDLGIGKSSLIIAAAAESLPTNVPPVLPPTRMPEDMFSEHVPVTVIDTSSSWEDRGKLADELKRADAVVLTYACDEPSTPDRLHTFWLPILGRLEILEVFYHAQKAVLHPTAALFDQKAQTLKPRCARALKRIFILNDHDRDGVLSDDELNDLQVKCFNAALQQRKMIILRAPDGNMVTVYDYRIRSVSKVISIIKAQHMMDRGSDTFLA